MALKFPTDTHRKAASAAVEFFSERPVVDAVLVVASCARGMAEPESDLDMAVLVSLPPGGEEWRSLERDWSVFGARSDLLAELRGLSVYAQLHLDLIDGTYEPQVWDDGGGPDDFEVLIGNQVAYAAALWEGNDRYERIRDTWLPYYDDSLRARRLAMVRDGVLLDLDFIPFYRRRGLSFQAFDRLYKAFREFLQGLFIARRTYPVAYNKWIRHQVVDLLGLPELYDELPAVLEVHELEGDAIRSNADHLRMLVEAFLR